MASTDCGWCGRLAHMQAASPLAFIPSDWEGHLAHAAYRCPNCHRLNVASEYNHQYLDRLELADTKAADGRSWGPNTEWLPKLGDRRTFPDVPPHIASAAEEATWCLSLEANRAVGSLARAVVEATCKDKGAKGRNLEARIDALAVGGHIREHTKQQAHEIRHFGNDMAHGDFADEVPNDEAAEMIELMKAILDEVYQSPARLEKVKAARLAKKADD